MMAANSCVGRYTLCTLISTAAAQVPNSLFTQFHWGMKAQLRAQPPSGGASFSTVLHCGTDELAAEFLPEPPTL